MSDFPIADTEGTTISKFDDETIMIRFKDGFNVQLKEAIEIRERSFEFFPGKKFLTIIDVTNIFGTVSPDAMQFFARDKKLTSRRMAQAIVVDNLPIKILANFYVRLKKPVREAKIFNEIEGAKKWLAQRKHLLKN